MTNEAAERLREYAAYAKDGWVRAPLSVVNNALAAERRATVERIRLEIRLSAFAANAHSKGPAYLEVLAILDAEAAK